MARSILQDKRECILTGYDGIYLDRHHVAVLVQISDLATAPISERPKSMIWLTFTIFGGANRKKAEAMGLWVWVRPELHRVGEGSIHRCRELDLQLKKWAERICLEVYDMSEDDFIREFGRNYLLSEADYNTEPPTVSIDTYIA